MDFALDLRPYIACYIFVVVGHISPFVSYENHILQRSTDYLEHVCWINNIFWIFPDLQTYLQNVHGRQDIMREKQNCQKIRKWPIWNEMRSLHEDIKSGGVGQSRHNIVSENGHWEYKANSHNVNETKAKLKGKIELIQKYISN